MRDRKHDIERYLRGELSPAEMHALEKEALNDPFLAEALEGVEHAGTDNFLHDLHRLNRSVHDRSRNHKKKIITMWGWTAGMAAAVLLVAVSGFLVVSLLNDQRARDLSLNEERSPVSETEDSLTIGSGSQPAETGETAEVPATEDKQAAARETKKPERVQPQGSPGGSVAEIREPPVEKDTQEKEPAEATADHEPLALAEIPEAGSPVREGKELEDQRSKKRSEAVGAAESQSPAVSRALARDSRLVNGRVTSAADGDGLPGVSVMLKGTTIGTATDARGNYQLPVPVDKGTLVFNSIGFEPNEVAVSDKPELNVALEEDVSTLSEVVVVSGYGSANDNSGQSATFSSAEPVQGRSGFKDYLNRAVKYPDEALTNKTEGRVTVRFAVEPGGELTDFEVVRGIGSGCDEELIRAIREGPAWQPASRDGQPLRDKVKVRFRFQLPE